MIKRLSKHNDYKDIIKSCPSGVIDDIYAIEYYIQGYNTVIQANFTKTGDVLEVILPSSDLETLPNGILMRRAFYKVLDASYPDGYYNLQFEDNMSVWLGEVESEEPVIPEYVTEEELAETLLDYATQEWVEDQGYITTSALSGYATESWVGSQGYLNSASLSGYATEQWVSSQQFATTSYVSNQISGVQAWVSSQSYLTSVTVSNYITESVIENLGFATESWVQSQGYLTSHQDLSSYATISWVSSQDYASKAWVTENLPSLTGYATVSYVDNQISGVMAWVGSQSYLTSTSLSNYITESAIEDLGFATQSWVSAQGYLTEHQSLDGYATESWVQSQGYLTSHQDLSSYATKSWVSSNYVAEAEVWTGTMTEWLNLTPAQRASYKFAFVTD
jgi:hypothetical protein